MLSTRPTAPLIMILGPWLRDVVSSTLILTPPLFDAPLSVLLAACGRAVPGRDLLSVSGPDFLSVSGRVVVVEVCFVASLIFVCLES